MRKCLSLIMTLILSVSTLVANPVLTITKGNIDSIDILNRQGEKVLDRNTLEVGYMLHTNDSSIEAESAIGTINLKPNSLIGITKADENPNLYLVFGEANLVTNGNLTVYTPTTYTTLKGQGESVFISTDAEEKFYNFTDNIATSYNAITGKSYDVGTLESLDLLTSSAPSAVDKEEYLSLSLINALYPVPTLADISAESTLFATPDNPNLLIESVAIIDSASKKSIATLYGDINIVAENGKATISYSDDVPNEILDTAMQSLIEKNPTIYSMLTIQSISDGKIEVSYPTEQSKEELAFALDIIANDINSYFIEVENNKNENAIPVFANPIDTVEDIGEEIAVADGDEAVEIQAVQTEQSTVKSSITSSIPTEKKFAFDIRLSTRAYTDSNQNQTLSLAIMPEFSYGEFKLALNLDPFAIMDYDDNEDWLDWVGYSANFIDTLQYRSLNEVFSLTIDKETSFSGDKLGLYDGIDHIWDKEYRQLVFNMGINSTHFGMRLFFSDLTFGRFANDENRLKDKGTAEIDFTYRISERYPVAFTIGALFDMDYSEFDKMLIYPELSLYIPFYAKGYNNIGLMLGFASRLDMDNTKYNPMDGGFIMSAALPMVFHDFSANASLHYTNQGNDNTTSTTLHYRGINGSRYTPNIDKVIPILTLASNIGYDSSIFGLNVAILGDVNTNNMRFIGENSLLEISSYLSIADVTLRAGMSMQDFTNGKKYEDDVRVYTGLDFDIGGVSTYLRAGIDSIKAKDFFLSYGATASFIGRSEDRLDNPVKIPFSFEITTGYEYHFEDKMSHYIIKPAITIGEGNYALSLRAPILLKFNNSSFALGGLGGREWWNFGSEEEGRRKIFYAITDSLQLINFITIGNPDSSLAYIDAQRDYLRNDTLFTAFGSDDALSIRTGFNFYNLSLELYAGDVESPHITQFKIGIYPIDLDGFSVDISIPMEFYIEDSKNFDLFLYPEARVNLPLFKNHFNIAAYAVGSISANYVNGEPTNTNVIYDFTNSRVFSALLGGEIGFKWSNFSITMQGGWRTGPLTPDMYNIFTSTYNQTPSLTNSEDKNAYFAKATMDFNFKVFSLEFAYSVNDIMTMVDDYKSMTGDIFSAKARVNFNNTISLYGSFHRKGFVSLFQKGIDIKDDIFLSANTIYSIGMDFDYGVVSINAEYSSLLNSDGFAENPKYLNVNRMYTDTTISSAFSVTTRIKF